MYEIGAGKADMTFFRKGVGMLGYGMYFNTAEGVDAPIYARAFIIKEADSDNHITLVNAEIAFPTICLKKAVVEKLANLMPSAGFSEKNIMLTANHTHSAVGGYSHYILYNITTPGFIPEALETYANSICEAIIEAWKNLEPGRIFLNSGSFEPEIDVAFNRSLAPYNSNPEVSPKLKSDETHLAVDRTMHLLSFESLTGKAIGSLNWFGVHPTSLSNDNHLISADNKGFAATYFEEAMAVKGENGFVAAFMQGTAGDITPNYIWDKKKKWTRGRFEDDFESAKYNGRLQFEKALEIFTKVKEGRELSGPLDFVHTYIDMSCIRVDKDFANGLDKQYTSPSVNGVAFLEGTVEGPGMPKPIGYVAKMMLLFIRFYYRSLAMITNKEERKNIFRKYRAQSRKWMIMETGEGRLLGTKKIKDLVIPAFIDRTIGDMKRLDREGFLKDKPWAPNILPIQVFILGDVSIAGIPMEITTIAGKRLRDTIQETLGTRGVKQTLLNPYANAYNGYITTFEEYQQQAYEGGHTPFGQWTLGAYRTKFRELAGQLLRKVEDRDDMNSLQAPVFEETDIWKGFKD